MFPNTSNFSRSDLHTSLNSPKKTPDRQIISPRSFQHKSRSLARKFRDRCSKNRLIAFNRSSGFRRSRVLGSHQSGLVAVPQGQTSVAGEPGAVQAPLRPEPATPSRGQAQGGRCAGKHWPQRGVRRGQRHAPPGQHIWRPVELSVPVPRDTFAFWIGRSDRKRAHRGRARVPR